MATVHVTLSRVDDRGDTGGALPVITSVPTLVDTILSTAVSQKSTLAAPKADGLVWSITALGNVWIAFGADPTAAAEAGHLVAAGQTRDFSVTTAGETVAVKDA
jgi:hypothetical protein